MLGVLHQRVGEREADAHQDRRNTGEDEQRRDVEDELGQRRHRSRGRVHCRFERS